MDSLIPQSHVMNKSAPPSIAFLIALLEIPCPSISLLGMKGITIPPNFLIAKYSKEAADVPSTS